MKSYVICPISDKKVNERVVRLNAVFTIILLIVFVMTKSVLPVVFLGIDFFLRASPLSDFSLIGISSKGIVKYFSINEYYINAGPKIFAARLGFVLTAVIILAFFLNFNSLAFGLAGIFGFFSFLEAAFGICVACEIYPFLYRLVYKSE
jgi:hypothetical protein